MIYIFVVVDWLTFQGVGHLTVYVNALWSGKSHWWSISHQKERKKKKWAQFVHRQIFTDECFLPLDGIPFFPSQQVGVLGYLVVQHYFTVLRNDWPPQTCSQVLHKISENKSAGWNCALIPAVEQQQQSIQKSMYIDWFLYIYSFFFLYFCFFY